MDRATDCVVFCKLEFPDKETLEEGIARRLKLAKYFRDKGETSEAEEVMAVVDRLLHTADNAGGRKRPT